MTYADREDSDRHAQLHMMISLTIYRYSRTSMARTLMARLQRLFRTHS